MQRRFLSRVLDGQILIRLERVHRLVFGAVVLENAPDLAEERDGDEVDEEENRPNHSIDHVVSEVAHRRHQIVPDEIGDAQRRQDEDADAQPERSDHGRSHGPVRHLLLPLLVLGDDARGIVQRADSENQRLDENDGAADHRKLQEGIFLRDGDQLVLFDRHVAIRLTDGDRIAGQ